MDLKAVAARLAADPKRKAILTTRGRVDSESPGPARDRTVEEMAEHLEKDRDTAVLVWTGKSWAAVLRDRSAPDKWAVTKLPATDASNKVGDRIPSARDAVEAAMKLSGSDLPDPEPSEA